MSQWQVLRGELRAEVSLLGEARGCRAPDGRVVDWLEVVFPIIETDGDDAWKSVGTGFFIGKWGLFATAKHVLVEDDEVQPGLAGVQILPRERAIIIRRLTNLSIHKVADVALVDLQH